MSKLICTSAIQGATETVARAKSKLAEAIAAKGADHRVGFPDTAYYLPVIYSFTGRKVEKLCDLQEVLAYCDDLLPAPPTAEVWLPYLGATLDAGVATLFAFEAIEACKTLIGPNPCDGIWLGAANDVIMRERGVEFVDGTAPGFAAVVGAAPSAQTAVQIARELQEKNLYVFMAGASHGATFAEQLASEGVQLGWETRLVPFGREVSAAIYALGFANRAALSFGGVAPGDFERNLRYNKNRIFAFVMALGEVDSEKYAAAAGAINYGFPTIADTDIPEILPTGVCTYEHVVANVPHEKIVDRALEVRGCKVKIAKVPIPVPYGRAFEGERIRKSDAHAEFGGNKTIAFEFVTMCEMDEIDDGVIEVLGPDIDAAPEGSALPLAIWVQVAGRKMQQDFEPVLERQIHHLLNGAEGIWHMGQRDIVWTRVSKAAYARGLRLRHYGEIIHAKFLNEYPAIVDKVNVTLITDPAEVERRLERARKVYVERNRRMESMTDESVDTFYSCLLCQSFAPNHVCIITPERLGLCGAYNWLDGKAAFEIDETGPNQPVGKGACLDPVRGIWEGVNNFVYQHSHKAISAFTAYSVMDRPMTSCGCFEVIVAYVPECNGVMAVNREYLGDTPTGMPFSTLAGTVGGGAQTPGFMGCGKAFLTSRKFLYADGGLSRLVWMPKELKEALRDDLMKRLQERGTPDLLDQIADETVATDSHAVLAFMQKVGHPARDLAEMGSLWSDGDEPVAATAQPPRAMEASLETVVEAPPAMKKAPVEPDAAVAKPLIAAEVEKPAPPAGPNGHLDRVALSAELKAELKGEILREVVGEIIGVLQEKFLGKRFAITSPTSGNGEAPTPVVETVTAREPLRYAADKLAAVTAFPIPKEPSSERIERVRFGATRAEGGTRGRTITLGGQNCLPFHFFEGNVPHPPVLALEVFDTVSDKVSPVLRAAWGDLLYQPVRMAEKCVEYGAEAVAVRLEGTHPEKGGKSAEQSLALVKEILAAVEVPLIITAHNHFDSANEVMKKIASACAGERLLLNWVESANYRTIAGVALAYGHCVVAQSPIDVNMCKQLNILLANMSIPRDRIVIDPLASALGYGLEYTYSVMERIRLTCLGGDNALSFPMILMVGQEAWKTKESRAAEADFPTWGNLNKRAVLWEIQTAMPFVQAGADLLVLNHPESLAAIRRTIHKLAANQKEN
ncbi:MAG: CO dehydrogenase/CO-methylating acetyl-CoA synthase complex subunit beta [Acidobacteria bacterium]|nr:CO dehydrogenase/CO-methylating acetyl-CoA synthase complex subunit beta [Acidobacteriota bacterium]MBI3657156.1 CO dehydrogenase/CO-methylating acetyl-CoA synthase complex subunit beta [Acidobacteriota bacterium]